MQTKGKILDPWTKQPTATAWFFVLLLLVDFDSSYVEVIIDK